MATIYYEDSAVTLWHGRCEDVLPTLADGSVDLVLTDPPYEKEAHTKARRVADGGRGVKVLEIPFDAITPELRSFTAQQAGRLARRWALTFCQVEAAMLWRGVYEAAGMNYVRTCVWVKPDGAPQFTGDRPGIGFESIVCMHQPGATRAGMAAAGGACLCIT